MAAAVPTTTKIISMGNVIGILGTFASAIGATDTWATGLATVSAVFITDGAAGGITGGATYSGGTVTFALSGSLAANAKILAIGT
jgi:hypothetical protein